MLYLHVVLLFMQYFVVLQAPALCTREVCTIVYIRTYLKVHTHVAGAAVVIVVIVAAAAAAAVVVVVVVVVIVVVVVAAAVAAGAAVVVVVDCDMGLGLK